jgi:hypothetical protein
MNRHAHEIAASAEASAAHGRTTSLSRNAPVLALFATLCILPLFLVVTIPQPVGPMLWDLYIYLDGTNRIAGGQVPSVDFFAPVGALGYYLFALAIRVFPDGHPLLLSAWSLLLVSAPLLALVLADVQRRSRATAFALLVPFLLYSLLPFNSGSFYPFPGSEGFGIYNRQVCQLLYVLSAALLFTRGRRLCLILAATMLALFFIKVTGTVAGALMCLMALAARRLPLRSAVAAGAAFCLVLAGLELATGIVSAYIADILALLAVNEETVLPRLLKAASMNVAVSLAAAALCVALAITNRHVVGSRMAAAAASPSLATLGSLLDLPFVWVGVFLAAGLFFESQNTGSQAMIFLWPLLLAIACDQYRRHGATARFAIVAALAMAVCLPPAMTVVQKASRAWVGMLGAVPLEHRHLKTLGAFAVRPLFAERARRTRPIYIADRAAFQALADSGEPSSFLLFSDFDFQWSWLQNADEAITAVLAYEAAHDMRFATVMTVDFVNPFPWLMDREAPRSIAIGADPTRAVPEPGPDEIAAISGVDLALLPTCPVTPMQRDLLALYGPALETTHVRVALTPCFDAFIRNDLSRPR